MIERSSDDLVDIRRHDGEDVCSPAECLARLGQPRATGRRLLVAATAVAAVIAIAATLAVFGPSADDTPTTRPGVDRSAAGSTPSETAPPTVTDLSPQPTPVGWQSHSLAGLADVATPGDWTTSEYRGAPATVYFPIVFFSNKPLTGPCTSATAPSTSCAMPNWFPTDTELATDQVLILWAEAEFPLSGPAFAHINGVDTTIDHRPSRLYSGGATDSCPSGASREINAYVRRDAHAYPGERFDMTACLGPNVSAANLHAVYTMLTTLRIHT